MSTSVDSSYDEDSDHVLRCIHGEVLIQGTKEYMQENITPEGVTNV